jgi:glycosyltransferase involved in cell wall biosynthesis
MSAKPSILIVTPVFNDWECLQALLPDLIESFAASAQVHVVVANDGSTQHENIDALKAAAFGCSSFEILDVACNVGHQRAIAIALSHVSGRSHISRVIVLDSDGEDRPSEALRVLEASWQEPDALFVGRRRSRSESLQFRGFYKVYKGLFRVMTGQRLDFGNLAVLPMDALPRITAMPEIWNHFPATLMQSRLPLRKIDADRNVRYFGTSKMNFVSLVGHGLAGISAFTNVVFVRLLVSLGIISGSLLAVGALGLFLQHFTTATVPEWATWAVVVALLLSLQFLALLAIVTFLVLSSRSVVNPPPHVTAQKYVQSVRVLIDESGSARSTDNSYDKP